MHPPAHWHEARSLIRVSASGEALLLPIVTYDRAHVSGVHMTDKHRHRHMVAPHGSAPNWVLMVLCVGAIAITVFSGLII